MRDNTMDNMKLAKGEVGTGNSFKLAKWVDEALKHASNATQQRQNKHIYRDRMGRRFILLANGAHKYLNLTTPSQGDRLLSKRISQRHHNRGF